MLDDVQLRRLLEELARVGLCPSLTGNETQKELRHMEDEAFDKCVSSGSVEVFKRCLEASSNGGDDLNKRCVFVGPNVFGVRL